MTSPTLEPYREEITTLLRQGHTKAEIMRRIEKKHGAPIKHTQFYDYVKQLSNDVTPPDEEESVMPPRETVTPEPVLENETVRVFFVELPRAVQEMTERLAVLEQKAGEQQQATMRALREFHETLTGFDKHLQAQPGQPSPVLPPVTAKSPAPSPAPVLAVTLRRIWKRAFLVSGVVWGLVELLLVRGYWRPLWAAIVSDRAG